MVFFVSDDFKILKILNYPHVLQLQEIFVLTLVKIDALDMAVLNSHNVQQVLSGTLYGIHNLYPMDGDLNPTTELISFRISESGGCTALLRDSMKTWCKEIRIPSQPYIDAYEMLNEQAAASSGGANVNSGSSQASYNVHSCTYISDKIPLCYGAQYHENIRLATIIIIVPLVDTSILAWLAIHDEMLIKKHSQARSQHLANPRTHASNPHSLAHAASYRLLAHSRTSRTIVAAIPCPYFQ
jgi:hypothetical protein